jgi:hypothetical protein
LHDTATGEAFRAIVDLELDDLLAIQPPRGYRRDWMQPGPSDA